MVGASSASGDVREIRGGRGAAGRDLADGRYHQLKPLLIGHPAGGIAGLQARIAPITGEQRRTQTVKPASKVPSFPVSQPSAHFGEGRDGAQRSPYVIGLNSKLGEIPCC